MSEQRRRLEKALRGCAEGWAPQATDPWPAIRDRVSGTAAGNTRANQTRTGTRTGEGGRAPGSPRRRPLLVPDHPMGWVLAVLSVLILGAGAYAASGLVRDLTRSGLPGPGADSTGETTDLETTNPEQPDWLAVGPQVPYRLFRGAVRGGGGEEIGLTQTADGARVTLGWAYADEEFVVVGIEAKDLDGAQRADGPLKGVDPVVLTPTLIGEDGEDEAKLPPRVDLTDSSGEDFTGVDGRTRYPGAVAVFEAPEGLEAADEHRFRLEVPLNEAGWPRRGEPDAGPFVFRFEIPVRPVSVVEVNQDATAKGITLTLERVVNSPARPQAVVCIDPPDDEHTWRTPLQELDGMPTDPATAPRQLSGNCWAHTLDEPVEGSSSVTVAYIDGLPRDPSDPDQDGKRIRGPWTFEFEAPAP